MNVQHLESLNDRVAELTGVRVRETFPDSVLADADEVVLIDLTPEALIQRLRDGRVYPAERVPAALNSFLKIENLSTLREVALREVAEEVESKRTVPEPVLGTREDLSSAEPPGAVRERLLALVSTSPRSQRVLRRAARSAHRLGAELDLLHVSKPAASLQGDERERLSDLRALATSLGAHLIVEEGDDLAQIAARVAAERALERSPQRAGHVAIVGRMGAGEVKERSG